MKNSKNYTWEPIKKTQTNENEDYMSWLKQEGEKDGIKWVVDWINGWDITVTKGDLVEHENIGGYEPRFGIDALDLNRIEETLEKFISKLKKM